MPIRETRDILDYNVTLGAVTYLLSLSFSVNLSAGFIRKYVALETEELVRDAIGFLKKLDMISIKSENGKRVIPKISKESLKYIRPTILNRLMRSNDSSVHYLATFIKLFLTKKKYYNKDDIWRMLIESRRVEGLSVSSDQTFKVKLRYLLRHLEELGLCLKCGDYIIPIIEPQLLLECFYAMKFYRGSLSEAINKLNSQYIPCVHSGVICKPLEISLSRLETYNLVKLSLISDFGLPYEINGKKYTFLEVLHHDASL